MVYYRRVFLAYHHDDNAWPPPHGQLNDDVVPKMDDDEVAVGDAQTDEPNAIANDVQRLHYTTVVFHGCYNSSLDVGIVVVAAVVVQMMLAAYVLLENRPDQNWPYLVEHADTLIRLL